MNQNWTRRLALVGLLTGLAFGAATLPARSQDTPADTGTLKVKDLGWLVGSWRGPLGKGVFTARYMTPTDGVMLSYSELHMEGKLAFHEFERFYVKDGKVLLQPYPGGKPAAQFTMTKLDPKQKLAVFENPKNEFPEQIEYRRLDETTVVITLSAPSKAPKKQQVYKLTRLK